MFVITIFFYLIMSTHMYFVLRLLLKAETKATFLDFMKHFVSFETSFDTKKGGEVGQTKIEPKS